VLRHVLYVLYDVVVSDCGTVGELAQLLHNVRVKDNAVVADTFHGLLHSALCLHDFELLARLLH
jgi:hypothetical protein